MAFEGTDHRQQAFDMARRVREQTQIADIWMMEDGTSSILFAGRFRRSDDLDARLAL